MPFTVLDPSLAEAAPTTTAGDPLNNVGMTLGSMETDLQDDLQGRGDLGNRSRRWINLSYRNLSAMLELNELNASVSFNFLLGQPFYLMPTALSWISWIGNEDSVDYLDGGRGFEMIDVQTYRMLPDSSSYGTTTQLLPYKYFRYGRMMVIWPTPTDVSVAAMDFRVRPADLVGLDDSPILPEEFHEPLYEMAKARALRGLGFRSEGDRVYNDALAYLRPLLNTDAQEKNAMHMVMQPIRCRSQLYRASR